MSTSTEKRRIILDGKHILNLAIAVLALLLAGCAENVTKEVAKSIDKSEKKVIELNKSPENKTRVKKITDLIALTKKSLEKREINKAFILSRRIEYFIEGIVKEEENRNNALIQLREAKELYENAKKTGAEIKCQDTMLKAKAEIKNAIVLNKAIPENIIKP